MYLSGGWTEYQNNRTLFIICRSLRLRSFDRSNQIRRLIDIMTSAKRTLFLAVAAATVALSSLGEGVAAASSSTSNVASPLSHRGLQRNGVVAICPDGSQCTRGRRCYKTGREGEDTGLEEYGCGDCFDIDDNNGRCEFAQEVFCVVSDNTDISRWFCVNEGKCINDQVGDIE